METRNRTSLAVISIVAVYALTTCWNLSLQTVANPDEPRYAAAAREMLRSGDWLVPKFNAAPRLVKPAFFYWLISSTDWLGQKIGLDPVTGMRLGPVLMGLLAVISLFFLAKRLIGLRAA